MKRDVYAYITTGLLLTALAFSVFLIVSDNLAPFTTQATVKTTSINVVPEVQGYIKSINVHEGEMVKKGDLLFQIDPLQYKLEQEKTKAQFELAQSQWELSNRYLIRIQRLFKKNLVSQETFDQATADEQAKKATLSAAKVALDIATLNLKRTTVLARSSGVVTNLSYSAGMYATTSSTVVHLVDNKKMWIEADFTEKGLRTLHPNSNVNIVYDAIPSEVFHGKIMSVDSAIQSGINNKNALSNITSESRWIRPQQKVRVRITTTSPQHIIAGSRASIMLRDHQLMSDVWMTLLSWMRYIY